MMHSSDATSGRHRFSTLMELFVPFRATLAEQPSRLAGTDGVFQTCKYSRRHTAVSFFVITSFCAAILAINRKKPRWKPPLFMRPCVWRLCLKVNCVTAEKSDRGSAANAHGQNANLAIGEEKAKCHRPQALFVNLCSQSKKWLHGHSRWGLSFGWGQCWRWMMHNSHSIYSSLLSRHPYPGLHV